MGRGWGAAILRPSCTSLEEFGDQEPDVFRVIPAGNGRANRPVGESENGELKERTMKRTEPCPD
jgi:hypothetical protein